MGTSSLHRIRIQYFTHPAKHTQLRELECTHWGAAHRTLIERNLCRSPERKPCYPHRKPLPKKQPPSTSTRASGRQPEEPYEPPPEEAALVLEERESHPGRTLKQDSVYRDTYGFHPYAENLVQTDDRRWKSS